MTQQEIEAELSYAYRHAVAARAGIACQPATRSFDNVGVDVELMAAGDFGPDLPREVFFHVQLKATIERPAVRADKLAYFLRGTEAYDRLRADAVTVPRVLVVLFLPSEPGEWLRQTEQQLALRRCAYWVSLRGAPETSNTGGQTIYLPRSQVLSPRGLLDLAGRMVRGEVPRYES